MLLWFHFSLLMTLGSQVCLGHVMMRCSKGLLNMEIYRGCLLGLLFVFYGNLLLGGYGFGILQIEIMDGTRCICLLSFVLLLLIRFLFPRLWVIAFILKSVLEKIRGYFYTDFWKFLINLKNFFLDLLVSGKALNSEDPEAFLWLVTIFLDELL